MWIGRGWGRSDRNSEGKDKDKLSGTNTLPWRKSRVRIGNNDLGRGLFYEISKPYGKVSGDQVKSGGEITR